MFRYKRRGWKYELTSPFVCYVGIDLPFVSHEFLTLTPMSKGCKLEVNVGYAWDGPSGPTIDTYSFMRGSLVHDVLYQLMREGLIPNVRKEADQELTKICLQDGMSKWRAWYVYWSVRVFGGKYAERS